MGTHPNSEQAIPSFSQASPIRPGKAKTKTQRSSFPYVTPIAVGLDYLSIVLGTVTAFAIYQLCRGVYVNNEALKLFAFSIQYAVAFVLFGRVHYLYSHGHSLLQIRDTAAILRVSSFSLILLSVGVLFSKMVIPRLLLLLSWGLITIFVLVQKHFTRRLFAWWMAKRSKDRRVMIMGTGSDARRIFSILLNSPDLQLRPVTFFEERSSGDSRVIYSHGYRFKDYAPVYCGQLDEETLRRFDISEIFVADPSLSPQRIGEIAALSSQCGAQLSFVGAAQPYLAARASNLRVLDGLFVSSFESETMPSVAYEVIKRIFDLALSSAMLAFSLPIFAAIGIWVKLTSPGPVLFRQERVGRDTKPFQMYKFRSMYITTPKYGRSPENASDPRITPAGRFLRKTSLDELPQLLNVFLGDMSLVGPRPEMPYIVSDYNSHQSHRLKVQQGLTGLWQLSADRKYAIHDSIEYDLYYIENRGFFLDMAILLHTLAFAMKGI